jgi:hypothetical protein
VQRSCRSSPSSSGSTSSRCASSAPDHVILAVVDAEDIESVREFILQSRLIQWNTTQIHATYSIEEALAKSDVLDAIY